MEPHPSEGGRSRLDFAPALTTAFAANGRLTLSLPLGARLFVKTTLPKFGVETRSLHLTLEPAKGPLEAFVVLNSYFQEITTPQQVGRIQNMEPTIKRPTREKKIVATAASGKSSFTVEGVGVEHVLLAMDEEVLDPHFERWHGNTRLDVLDDEHT